MVPPLVARLVNFEVIVSGASVLRSPAKFARIWTADHPALSLRVDHPKCSHMEEDQCHWQS
jgi:hypothetical protein